MIPPTDPGGTVDALRAAPRLFIPKDPIVLVQGGQARLRARQQRPHRGRPGRLPADTGLGAELDQIRRRRQVRLGGSDVLERGVENGSVPLECEGLLQETALLDTGEARRSRRPRRGPTTRTAERNVDGRADRLVRAAKPARRPRPAARAQRHLRHAAGPDRALRRRRGRGRRCTSTGPSSSCPRRTASRTGSSTSSTYVLGRAGDRPGRPAAAITFIGRSPVTGGASATLASAINNALDQAARIGGHRARARPDVGRQPAESASTRRWPERWSRSSQAHEDRPSTSESPATPAQLKTIATRARAHGCAVLRAGRPADAICGAAWQPDGAIHAPGGTSRRRSSRCGPGFLRLVRLRLVDGFGQFVDLCGSDATHAAQGYLVSGPLTVAGQPGVVGLPPRFSRSDPRLCSAS